MIVCDMSYLRCRKRRGEAARELLFVVQVDPVLVPLSWPRTNATRREPCGQIESISTTFLVEPATALDKPPLDIETAHRPLRHRRVLDGRSSTDRYSV